MRLALPSSRLIILTLLALVLTACGGGGTGSPLGNGGTGGGAVVTPFFAATGPGGVDLSTVTISFTDSADITVQVTDESGAVLPTQTVDYSFDVPVASTKVSSQPSRAVVASGTLTSDPSGIITIPLVITDPSAFGTGTLTLSSSGFFAEFDVAVVSAAGIPADIELALVDINTGLPVTGIEFTSGARVEVTVTEADGAALSEDAIADAAISAGSVSPAGRVVTAAGGGITTFDVSRADGISDFQAVEITVSMDVQDQNGAIQTVTESLLSEFLPSGATGTGGGAAGVPSSLLPLPFLQDPDSPGIAVVAISAEDPGELIVTVVDVNGDPVSGAIVSVQTDLGELSPSLGNVLTDASGEATIGLSVGDGESGAAGTLTISVGNDLQYTTNFEIIDTGTSSTSGLALALQLFNSTDGTATSTINSVEPGLLRATLTNVISGLPVEGEIVEISVDVGDPELTPASGQILTNASGVAEIIIGVGNSDTGAAISLLADVVDISASIQFSVGSANIALGFESDGSYATLEDIADNLGEINVGNGTSSLSNLSAAGTTTLDVGVYNIDTGALLTEPVTVNFETNCANATVDTGVTSVNGVARAVFAADALCEGPVSITATLAELGGTATGTVEVLGTTVNSIEFVDATPTNLVLSGTGGTETSLVRFRVKDNTGENKPDINVDFSLSSAVGGLNLTNTTATSNGEGLVTATVNSGSIPTAAQVIATITVDPDMVASSGDEYEVSTVSSTLSVSTGLPDQGSFSVVADILNPGGGNLDGIESQITIRASDAFNNPVPDGTTIVFTTEYGQIEPQCSIENGACTVTWTSAGGSVLVSPATGTLRTITAGNLTGCPGVFPGTGPCLNEATFPDEQIYSGRNTILATTLGEESFVDANGSGLYDWIDLDNDGLYEPLDGETLEIFEDLDEAFVDENEDGVFGNDLTPGACTSAADPDGPECVNWITGGGEDTHVETFPETAIGNGVFDRGNGIYNGRLCHPDLESLATPLCSFEPVLVRDSVVLVMSGNKPVLSLRDNSPRALHDGVVDLTGIATSETVILYASDFQNGRLPAGTVIDVAVTNCDIAGTTTFEVPNSNDEGFTVISLTLSNDGDTSEGQVNIEVTTPESVDDYTEIISFACLD